MSLLAFDRKLHVDRAPPSGGELINYMYLGLLLAMSQSRPRVVVPGVTKPYGTFMKDHAPGASSAHRYRTYILYSEHIN